MPPRRRPALTVDVGSPRGAAARGGAGGPGHAAGVQASVQLSFCEDGRLKLPGGTGGACQITERDVRLLSVLGRGASAVVHRGELLPSHAPVAVKRVVAADAAARAQVLRDVAALATPPGTAPPPGLVPLLGAYAEGGGGRVALVLALMEGGSLADAVARAGGDAGLPEPVLGSVACGVVAGLNYIHGVKRMVHRDIKPANVLLDARGAALLADFGVAAAVGDGSVAACTTFLGTAAYLAPERARGGAYSFPADVWALGLTLLEAATGKHPYDVSGGPLALLLALADDPSPRVPPGARGVDGVVYSSDLADFVAACLEKDPMARPTAAALARHHFITRWSGRTDAVPSAPPLPLGEGVSSPPRLGRVTATAARSRSPSPDGGRRDGASVDQPRPRDDCSPPPLDHGSPPPTARCSSPRLTDTGAAAPLSPSLTAAATATAHALFAARAHATSAARRAALAPLYDARASLTLEGRPVLYGARDVVAALDAAAAGAATLGGGAPRLAAVDVLPLPGGGALVLATGTVPAPGPGPLAAARGGGGAAVRPPRACCDAVTLARGPRGAAGLRIVAHVCRTQF